MIYIVYNDESFLHRLSFQGLPLLSPEQPLYGSGLRGTAGSTRSDELFVDGLLRLRYDFQEPVFVSARFARQEDYDGRHDSFLIGLGTRYQDWELSLLGDIVGSKEDIDIQAKLAWIPSEETALSLSLVLVDAPFNDKQEAGSYLRAPYSLHLHLRHAIFSATKLEGFVQVDLPMRLEDELSGVISDAEALAAGLRGHIAQADSWMWAASLQGEYALRRGYFSPLRAAWEILSPPDTERLPLDNTQARHWSLRHSLSQAQDPPRHRFRRAAGRANLEVAASASARAEWWLGLQAFFLKERDRRAPRDWLDSLHRRREYTAYLGRRWNVWSEWDFAPSLYLAYLDVKTSFPQHAISGFFHIIEHDDHDLPPYHHHSRGFFGKIAPLFSYHFRNQRGRISINPTFYLHRAAFGGGNIQLFFPW